MWPRGVDEPGTAHRGRAAPGAGGRGARQDAGGCISHACWKREGGRMNVVFVARNVFRRLRHDWLTVIMLGTIPLLFILLFGYAFSGTPTDIPIVIVNHDSGKVTVNTKEFGTITLEKKMSDDLISGFGDHVFRARVMDNAEKAQDLVKRGIARAVIEIAPGFSQDMIDRVLSVTGGMTYSYHGQIVHLLPRAASGESTPPLLLSVDRSDVPTADTIVATVRYSLNTLFLSYLAGEDATLNWRDMMHTDDIYAAGAGYMDYYSPGVIGFAVTVITSMLTLISLVREERSGVLQRLLASAIHPWELSMGYTLAFTIISLVQALEVILIAYFLFHTMFVGSLLLMLLVIIIYTIGLQGLGTLLSGLARNE
ncbi:MAG TPA: ABC-2 transporter permease, partial [Candidatus Acetothermia bacterium]|nr:ABC-2 transporter permease [Candidatus Acetothermia bacterium]